MSFRPENVEAAYKKTFSQQLEEEAKEMQDRVKELKKEQEELEEYIKENKRQRASLSPQKIKTRMPRIGDHVVAMWGMSKWQYFTATVVDYNPVEM